MNKKALFILPSFIGISIFYLIPFACAFFRTIMSGGAHPRYVGLKNYCDLLSNPIFLRGLKNTCLFVGIAVPLGMFFALLIALGIRVLEKYKGILQCLVLIPLVIPSASVAFFWKNFFAVQGPFNQWIEKVWLFFNLKQAYEYIDWLESDFGLAIIVFIFIWKNLGYNTILFTAGIYQIPSTYYESAMIDGADSWAKFRWITWPCLMPTTVMVFIMSIINSFKVFKEIYLIVGAYPDERIYLLQHYMNNVFMKLDYQKLSTAAYIFIVFVLMLLGILHMGTRRGHQDAEG